jgi:hypothetical protein
MRSLTKKKGQVKTQLFLMKKSWQKNSLLCRDFLLKDGIATFRNISFAKRAQITLFIILAIMIVLVIFGVYFWVNRDGVSSGGIDVAGLSGAERMDYELAVCINEYLPLAVQLLSLRGGAIENIGESIITDLGEINILYDGETPAYVTSASIQSEISSFLEVTLGSCLDDDAYTQLNFSTRSIFAETIISQDKVISLADIILDIQEKDKNEVLTIPLTSEISIHTLPMSQTANEILRIHDRDPTQIDITFLSSLPYDITFLPWEDSYIIFIITDENSKINEVPVSFMFGVKK